MLKTAFLHGNLVEEIYMEKLKVFGFNEKENCVCKLKKSLYSLKQAHKQWYMKFGSIMSQQGFKKTSSDNHIFVQNL